MVNASQTVLGRHPRGRMAVPVPCTRMYEEHFQNSHICTHLHPRDFFLAACEYARARAVSACTVPYGSCNAKTTNKGAGFIVAKWCAYRF